MAKVLVFCHEVIGKSMAGPGIRYWEIASALSKHHKVTLAAPNVPDMDGDGFTIVSYERTRISKVVRGYDVVIAQLISPEMAYVARRQNIRIILDAYDPILLEALEVFRHESPQQQRNVNKRYWAEMSLSFLAADAIICSTEKQRDLWIGALMALDRIRPVLYAQDASLRNFIDVVPFGLRNQDPVKAGPGLRAKFGVKETDKVLLWAGGIYDWYDTFTLVRAMEIISKKRHDVKLAFLGLKHPNAGVLESTLTGKTKALSDKLGLTDKTIIFNFDWIPYQEWPNYLLESDIGLSTHFEHLETRFSFRTRVIDSYLWGLRPIITTKGDAMADLVTKEKIGRAVEYENAQDLADAVIELIDNPDEYKLMQKRMIDLREQYRWSKVVKPINAMVTNTMKLPARGLAWSELKLMAGIYFYTFQQVREGKGLRYVMTRAMGKLAGVVSGRRA